MSATKKRKESEDAGHQRKPVHVDAGVPPMVYSKAEAQAALRIGRSKLEEILPQIGYIQSCAGGKILIPVTAIEAWLEKQLIRI